jgi:hypothetical protein
LTSRQLTRRKQFFSDGHRETTGQLDASRLTIPSLVMGKRIDSILNFGKDERQVPPILEETQLGKDTSLQDLEGTSVGQENTDKRQPFLQPYIEEAEPEAKKKPIFRYLIIQLNQN